MSVPLSVVYLGAEKSEHQANFERLFRDYSAALSVEVAPDLVSQLFQLPYFHGFIAMVGNMSAGFAVCFESYSTYRAKKVLNIHDFMVAKSFRGTGVGKELLQGIEAYARSNDYLKITLEVDDDNIAAKKLYQACQFEDHQVKLKGLLHWQKYLD